jgi:hypothetical protein
MNDRCGWCGVFVSADTEGVPGVNVRGETLVQILCPPHARHWRDLSARNAAHLSREAVTPDGK